MGRPHHPRRPHRGGLRTKKHHYDCPKTLTHPTAFEQAGVLRSAIVGRRRNRVWYTPEVTDALDDFAEQTKRREF